MIKLIIFDLDGVLVEAKKIHYEALNQALTEEGDQFTIDWDEHLNVFDGLKTSEKLKLLHERKALPIESFSRIWERKQKITLEALKEVKFDKNLYDAFYELSKKYKIACCSNSIRKTILTVLSRLGIIEFFDLILSNEDVINSKPHPEIYWKTISAMSCLPEEVLILEDSPYGLLAASRSHSNLLRVREPQEVNLTNIKNRLNELNNKKSNMIPKWKDKNLNVLIPMAGAGSRFEKAGYTFPKPLIEVDKRPMIQVVVENLNIDANYIFIVQKSHREKYNLDTMLNLIAPNCKIVDVDGITEGAACTTLLAKEFINNDCPLVMANSDQFVEWNSNDFMYSMNETGCDGGIVTFTATHPKWSFAKVDELTGLVSEVAEKNPISDMATVGIYYWSKGSSYVKYAEEMIKENIRVNNEFYVCPVFNQAIKDRKKIRTYKASEMWGLGTPEDLEHYMKDKKNDKS